MLTYNRRVTRETSHILDSFILNKIGMKRKLVKTSSNFDSVPFSYKSVSWEIYESIYCIDSYVKKKYYEEGTII